MKYTKHLQLLLEKNLSIGSLKEDGSINVTLGFSQWKIWIKQNLLHIAPTNEENTEAPEYIIEIKKNINDILNEIISKLESKPGLQDIDRQDRFKNIKNITEVEKTKLQTALNELLLKQNKIAA